MGTLYGYFRRKQELLRAVVDFDLTDWVDRLGDVLIESENLRDGLIALGIAYLTRRLSGSPISHVCLGAAPSTPSTFGEDFYRTVLRPAWQRLADRFERLMDQGRLVRADPWTAAIHWKALSECEMFERRLLGELAEPAATQIKRAATSAADAFLKIYGQHAGTPFRSDLDTATG